MVVAKVFRAYVSKLALLALMLANRSGHIYIYITSKLGCIYIYIHPNLLVLLPASGQLARPYNIPT